MTDTAGAQLLVEGPQDVWLTLDPQMSFFRSSYKRHVPFAMSLERVRVDPGGLVRFDVSKGDLLGYVYITAHDLTTDALVPTPITFTSMSTRLGEQIIDKRDLTYMNTIRPLLEAKNENQRKAPVGFQPLWLPFTGAYFPLVAIRYSQLDLLIEGLSPAYTYKVWCEAIHLPYEERRWFETTNHHLMIQQVRKTVPLNGELCLSGPIKYIAWPSFNYKAQYISEFQPVIADPGLTIIRTQTANTFSVSQTTNFYGVTAIVWSTSTLPAGVTIQSTTNNQITFALAALTAVAPQPFQVSVTTPYGKTATMSFTFGANPIVDFYVISNISNAFYLINNTGNPTLLVKRASIIIFEMNAPGYPFVVQSVVAPYDPGYVYVDGLTNAGAATGTIIWQVPVTAPALLYYVAQTSALMTNTIFVSS